MRFIFKINNEILFDAKLKTFQCEAINKNGTQCKRHVCIGLNLCWNHMLYYKHLRIKKSNIPNAGNGLYALDLQKNDNDVIFKKGEKICEYYGEVVTLEELKKKDTEIIRRRTVLWLMQQKIYIRMVLFSEASVV